MRSILVTGMSGTGKSTALVELRRRGFRVVDTDSPLWSEWAQDEWLWREDRMAELLAAADERPLFVSGCMWNQVKFYDRFDAVVLLSAPAEVILERVGRRTTNDYGKTAAERALILHHLESVEPRLRSTCTHELDASRPLEEVVDALAAIAGRRPRRAASAAPAPRAAASRGGRRGAGSRTTRPEAARPSSARP